MAEERTTEEEKLHIMEARRRAAAKRKKLKHLGKSRSTDTEDEENEDEPDEGKRTKNKNVHDMNNLYKIFSSSINFYIQFQFRTHLSFSIISQIYTLMYRADF